MYFLYKQTDLLRQKNLAPPPKPVSFADLLVCLFVNDAVMSFGEWRKGQI